jgi:hypothetical protein
MNCNWKRMCCDNADGRRAAPLRTRVNSASAAVRTRTVLAVVATLFAPSPLLAQSRELEPGVRVRVTAPSFQLSPLIGSFQELDARLSRLTLLTGGDEVEIPISAVRQLEVSQGTRSYAGLGAAIGLGAGLTYATTLVILGEGAMSGDLLYLGYWIAGGTGALVGAIVGSLVETERWEEVPVEKLRISIVSNGRSGFAISLAISH